MTIEEIIARLQGNEVEQSQVVNVLSTLPIFQSLMNNKVEALYNTKISAEVKKIHDQYDADIFSILNESPGTNEDGTRQKTYDHVKKLVTELKELRTKAESLNTDTEIQRLKTELENAKKGSNNEVLEKQVKELQAKIENDKRSYEEQIKNKSAELETFKKQTLIDAGLKGLNFNPDINDSLKNMVIANVLQQLQSSSKFGEDGQLIFLDDKGEPILNETQNVATVQDMISKNEALSSILLKTVTQGGGAPDNPGGKTGTRVVEVSGKKLNGLIFNEGLKTKSDFQRLSEKALIDMGIERTSPEWKSLESEAYNTYKVDSLPIS